MPSSETAHTVQDIGNAVAKGAQGTGAAVARGMQDAGAEIADGGDHAAKHRHEPLPQTLGIGRRTRRLAEQLERVRRYGAYHRRLAALRPCSSAPPNRIADELSDSITRLSQRWAETFSSAPRTGRRKANRLPNHLE